VNQTDDGQKKAIKTLGVSESPEVSSRVSGVLTEIATRRLKADEAGIREAGAIIRSGGLVVFPTETVWGIGADATNQKAVERIFMAKGRPQDNPLIVHVADVDSVSLAAQEVSEAEQLLFKAFSPGPITIILPRNASIAKAVTAGLDTVGVRIPSHPVAHAFLLAAGVPVAAPSANRSGRPSPTDADMAFHELGGRVDAILEGESSIVGVESTIVWVNDQRAHILRHGGVGPDEVEKALQRGGSKVHLESDATRNASPTTPRAPGTRYRHYSPQALVIPASTNSIKDDSSFIGHELFARGVPTAALVGLCLPSALQDLARGVLNKAGYKTTVLSTPETSSGLARVLFRSLCEADVRACAALLVWYPDDVGGLGPAVRDRVSRAAGKS